VRHGVAIAVAIALLIGAPRADTAGRAGIEVDVRVTVRPDSEDSNPLGGRQFLVRFTVRLAAGRTCDELRLAYRYRILFDGRLDQNQQQRATSTVGSASSAVFTIDPPGPTPGETIPLNATGECVAGSTVERSARATRTVQIPPHSCEQGPLRVLQLRGAAAREDLAVMNKLVPLRRRDYVLTAYTAWLGRGGRIAFGAPQCDGFRIALRGGGFFFPGTYARRYSGNVTGVARGQHARFVGDQHAGGIETENALVTPTGRRFGPPRLSSFDVYSFPRRVGRLTRVRVLRGAAWVSGGPGGGAMSERIRIEAGYETLVRCSSYRRCRPDPPRPF
jgi:hypothetical protein